MKYGGKFKHVLFLIIVFFFVQCRNEMEPFIVGGALADIESFPHSVFMYVESSEGAFLCGGSILNQDTLLTAAHCLIKPECSITVSVGSTGAYGLQQAAAHSFIFHPKFQSFSFANDIGIVCLRRSLTLGKNVKRVAILKTTDYNQVGLVAGWGMVDEVTVTGSNYLKYAKQRLLTRGECLRHIDIPLGAFCASPLAKGAGYAASGDSGSALVISGYIQVGVVSFKVPETRVNVVAFTDVSYHYNWIKQTAAELYCRRRRKPNTNKLYPI